MIADDHILVEKICRGDPQAFREIVERHKRKVFFLAYDILGDHHEAEDISQEVFIKVFRSLRNFRRDAKMSSWIHHITVNACIDVLRKKRGKTSVSVDEHTQTWSADAPSRGFGADADPELRADASLLQSRIDQALQNVSPRERTVFVMRHYNEFPIHEIADVLNISSGTVKSLLFRALQKMRRQLSVYAEKPQWEVSYE